MVLSTIVKNNRTLSIINEICLKRDVCDGSVLDGCRQPFLYTFILDKPARYKFFSQAETKRNRKLNKSTLNTIFFN